MDWEESPSSSGLVLLDAKKPWGKRVVGKRRVGDETYKSCFACDEDFTGRAVGGRWYHRRYS